MSYDDNFDKAFQDHDVIVDGGDNTIRSNKDMPRTHVSICVDDNFHKEKRQYNNVWNGVFNKFVNVSFYSSKGTGTQIRDAISGEYSRYLVGSSGQNLFFKVVHTTGFRKNSPLHLYYASPEQYEAHQYVVLDDLIKQRWYDKYDSITHQK